jgi:YhcH/YjgK/YiaL family protein
MIIGKIVDFDPKYFAFSKNLSLAFAFMKEKGVEGLLALPAGKTVLDEGNVFVNRQSYIGKKFEDAKIESHYKWLDIQIVLKGVEGFGYADISKNLPVTVPYDEVKDKVNYEGKLDGIINLEGGTFALVFPPDLHKPCIKVNDETIEKAVIKVRIDWDC